MCIVRAALGKDRLEEGMAGKLELDEVIGFYRDSEKGLFYDLMGNDCALMITVVLHGWRPTCISKRPCLCVYVENTQSPL